MTMLKRFDSVLLNEQSAELHAEFKALFETLALDIKTRLDPSREKSLALTRLDEAYMWTGKAIETDQLRYEK